MSEPERWLPVPGYERTYEVSSEGRVRSIPRRRTKGGVLSLKMGKRGYPAVSLCQDGRQRTQEVHRVVTAAFLGPRPEGMAVRHLDGNPGNNKLSNLTYGTYSQNVLDKRAHGTDHNVAKDACPAGHPYDATNTYVSPSRGSRHCRKCNSAQSLARYHARRAA